MPNPAHGITPHDFTEPDGLVRFDLKIGKSAAVESVKYSAEAIENGKGSESGHAGAQLTSSDGKMPSVAKGAGQAQDFELAPNFNTNPNPYRRRTICSPI